MLRRSASLLAAVALALVGATASTAAILPMPATLDLAIGTLPPLSLSGVAPAASSAGAGGAATLPAGAIAGAPIATIAPPLLGQIDRVAIAWSCCDLLVQATNQALSFDGTTGTMGIDGSAYLLMWPNTVGVIPLGVVGVGGTQMFHVLTLVQGVIHGNPYQLGMLTVMGALNTAPHTLMATGYDARSAGGAGQLVLVSPTTVDLGLLGTLAGLSTLTLGVPEPGTLALVLLGVAGLAARGWRQRSESAASGR